MHFRLAMGLLSTQLAYALLRFHNYDSVQLTDSRVNTRSAFLLHFTHKLGTRHDRVS